MAAFVTLADFQAFVGNTRAEDAAAMQFAIDTGCAKVDELCGPTLTATVTDKLLTGRGPARYLSARPAALVSVASYPSGDAADVALFDFDGQRLFRRDGLDIVGALTVSYTTGAATAPTWAASAAMLIAHQWFKSRLQPNLSTPGTAPVGFLVPNQADELMAEHYLAPGGFA